jgi:hypothetical protein
VKYRELSPSPVYVRSQIQCLFRLPFFIVLTSVLVVFSGSLLFLLSFCHIVASWALGLCLTLCSTIQRLWDPPSLCLSTTDISHHRSTLNICLLILTHGGVSEYWTSPAFFCNSYLYTNFPLSSSRKFKLKIFSNYPCINIYLK